MKSKTLSRMYKMLKPEKNAIIVISIIAIVISIGEVLRPYLIKTVIDDYLSAGVWQKGEMTIGIIGGAYIGIVILGNILDFIISTATTMVGEKIIYQIRNKLYKYIQYANISFHDRTPSGTLFVRITSDVEDITTCFKDVVTTFVKDIVIIIALAVTMVWLDYKLSIVCFILIPLVTLTSFIINSISRKVQEASKRAKTKLNIFLSESIYGVKLIKIFNRQYEKNKECKDFCQAFYKSRVPTAFIEAFIVAFMRLFENLGISLIVWVCINHFFGINLEVRDNIYFHNIHKANI